MFAKIWERTRSFAAWILSSVLISVLLVLGYDLWMSFFVFTLGAGKYQNNFLRISYYMIAGLAWLAFVLLIEAYFERQRQRGYLLRGVLRVIGIQVLSIGLVVAVLLGYGLFGFKWSVIALAGTTILAGGTMCYFGYRQTTTPETRTAS